MPSHGSPIKPKFCLGFSKSNADPHLKQPEETPGALICINVFYNYMYQQQEPQNICQLIGKKQKQSKWKKAHFHIPFNTFLFIVLR